MNDLRKELLAAFDVEHKEHVKAIRAVLEAARLGVPLQLHDAFRRAHSLKGAARAVDLPGVEEIAHRLEALFASLQDGERQLDPSMVAGIELGLDAIEDYAAAAADGSHIPPVPLDTLATLDAVLAQGEVPQDELPGLFGGEEPAPKPASAAMGSEAGSEAGSKAEAREATASPTVAPVPPDAESSPEYLRVEARQLGRLAETVHGLNAELQRQEDIARDASRFVRDMRGLRRQWDEVVLQGSTLTAAMRQGDADPRRFESRLKEFDHQFKGWFRRIRQLAHDRHMIAAAIDRAGRSLAERVEEISLVPAEEVLGSLARMVRELAREAGRAVEMRMTGLELRADRRVLQTLRDPAIHLLRNAIGHGAETPGERQAHGKPEAMLVGLDLASRGGHLVLTVYDDGRGPDLAAIEARGIERGLLSPRGPDTAPPPAEHLLSLVFDPGFSTAAEVDRLSGRGMGLSVVSEAAHTLRGSVWFRPRNESQGGSGAEVVLTVPLSAARQSLLLVEAEHRQFALPAASVERLLRLPAERLESVEGRPSIRIPTTASDRIQSDGEDVILPLVPFAALVGMKGVQVPVEAGHVNVALLSDGARRCAAAVSGLDDVRTMIVSPAAGIGLDPELVSGVVLADAGQPVLVLNADVLIRRSFGSTDYLGGGSGGPVGLGWQPAVDRRGATILVVDDSLTTRTLEKSVLEAQGYRVLISVDGLDALDRLRSGESVVDLILADVEMPRMDGFGLLQAIRNDPHLSNLPVVLMTSREDPEDIRRGLDLGANAYLTKQKFDQRELLATIGQML